MSGVLLTMRITILKTAKIKLIKVEYANILKFFFITVANEINTAEIIPAILAALLNNLNIPVKKSFISPNISL